MRSSFRYLKLTFGAACILLLAVAICLAQGQPANSTGPAPRSERTITAPAINTETLKPLDSYWTIATRVMPFPARPFKFSTDTPGTISLFGDTLATNFFAGGILLDGKAYAVEYGGNNLYRIDTTTGAFTLIGPMVPSGSEQWTGMAWDPTTHTAYATSDKSLYTVNLATGELLYVASYSNSSELMISIAVSNEGQMYGVGIANDSLFRIDKATGTMSTVGTIGFNANYAQDLAFERTSGTLFYADYNLSAGGSELRTVDIATGATTLIGPFPAGHQVDALMFAESSVGLAEAPQYFNLNNGMSSNTFPFNQSAGKAVNWLFRAGEFNQPSSLPQDQKITRVYFRMASTGMRTFTDLIILMAQDTITNLPSAAFYPGPYDTVYYHPTAILSSAVDQWMSITLDKPFAYDPTKSLIIFVGTCGSSGTGMNVRYTNLSPDIRRDWSVGGCPFVPYGSSGDGAMLNFGVDVIPNTIVPQYFNSNTAVSNNFFPFDVSGGKAVNWMLLPGELNMPNPLPADHAITTLYFRMGSHSTKTLTDLVVLMAQDNATTMTSGQFYPGPYDTVYAHSSATISSTVEGWMPIRLDHPFRYDPTKSLIIFVGQCGSTGPTMFIRQSPKSDMRRVWSVGGCPFTPYANADAQLADIGVDVVPAASVYNVPELLYYKFENNSPAGFTINDALPGMGTSPAPFTGSIGWGAAFDSALVGTGLSSQGVNTGWNLDIRSHNWTIGMWLQIPTVSDGTPDYLFGDEGAASFRSFHNGLAYPNNLMLRGGGMLDLYVVGIGPAPTYVHFVYDSATATVTAYKNGVFDTSVVQPSPLDIHAGSGFIAGGYGTNTGFKGLMDEFRFYARALNAEEVWRTWNQTLPFVITGVQEESRTVPVTYALDQNYPNPFNPSTVIGYQLPVTSNVKLVVYDLLGREVKTLVNEQNVSGAFRVTWNGENSYGHRVASGVYFYRLTAAANGKGASFTSVRKMILLK